MTDKYLLFIMEINCLRFPRVPPLLCAGVPLRGRCQTFSFLNSVWGHASFLVSHSLWSLLTTTREWRTHGKSWKAYRRLHNTSSSSLQCLSPQTLYFSSRLDVLTHRVMEKARWEANIRPEPRAHKKKKKGSDSFRESTSLTNEAQNRVEIRRTLRLCLRNQTAILMLNVFTGGGIYISGCYFSWTLVIFISLPFKPQQH